MYNCKGEWVSTRGFFCTGMKKQQRAAPFRMPYVIYRQDFPYNRMVPGSYRREDKSVEVLLEEDDIEDAKRATKQYEDEEDEEIMVQHSYELVRIPYRDYKNQFPNVPTMKGSYDPETKTVEVIVNSYTEPELYEQVKRYEWNEEKGRAGSVEAYRQDCLKRSLAEVGITFHPLKG